MNINVTITEKELNDFYNYGKKLRESPCIGCRDKAYCCGCRRQSEWLQELESLPVTSVDWDKYEDIRKYTEAALDRDEVEIEMGKLHRKRTDLCKKITEFRTKFDVVE